MLNLIWISGLCSCLSLSWSHHVTVPCILFYVSGETREKSESLGLQMEGTSYRHERPHGSDNDPLHKVQSKLSVDSYSICTCPPSYFSYFCFMQTYFLSWLKEKKYSIATRHSIIQFCCIKQDRKWYRMFRTDFTFRDLRWITAGKFLPLQGYARWRHVCFRALHDSLVNPQSNVH